MYISNNNLLLSLIILIFIIILNLIFLLDSNFLSIYFLEFILSVSFGLSIIYALKFNRKYPLLLLVLSMFGLLIYSRYILDVLGLMSFDNKIATRFLGYIFSDVTFKKTLLVYVTSSFATLISILLIIVNNKNRNNHEQYKYNSNNHNNIARNRIKVNGSIDTVPSRIQKRTNRKIGQLNLKSIGFILLLLSAPGIVLKIFLLINHITTYGYLAFYLQLDLAEWERIVEFLSYRIYILGLSCCFASNLTNNEFRIIALLMLILGGVYLFLGKRLELGVNILFLIWYYYSYIGKENTTNGSIVLILRGYLKSVNGLIKGAVLLIITYLLLILMQNISDTRSQIENSTSNKVISFIEHQGVSGTVLSYYIDFEEGISNRSYPFIIAPIVDRFYRSTGQSKELIDNTNYLGYELTYAVDSDKFLNGEGLGSSYIVELYEFGQVGVFIGMAILILLIYFFEKNKYKTIIKFLAFIVVSTLLPLARGEIFEYFYEFLLLLLFWWILSFQKIGVKRSV